MIIFKKKLKNSNKPGSNSYPEIEKLVSAARFDSEQPEPKFKDKLLSELKAKQFSTKTMKTLPSNFWRAKLIPLTFGLVGICAVLLFLFLFGLPKSKPEQLGTNAAKTLVVQQPTGITNLEDQFILTPLEKNETGINPNTTFELTAKIKTTLEKVKESLSFSPKVAYAVEVKDENTFLIKPQEPLSTDNLLQASMKVAFVADNGETQQQQYSWAYQVQEKFQVVSTLPRNRATDVPIDTGVEITFSHLNFTGVEENFSINPQVAGRFEIHRKTAVFIPNEPLQKNTYYTVHLGKGVSLPATGETLIDDLNFGFETVTEDIDYSISGITSINQKTIETSTSKVPSFYVSGHNLNSSFETNLAIYQLPDENSFSQAFENYQSVPYWASQARQDWRTDTANLILHSSTAVKVQDLGYYQFAVFAPETLPAGFYLIEITGASDRQLQALLQVSELTSYVSVSETKLLVWLNSASDVQPISGAEIQLNGDTNLGTTDNQGLLTVATPETVLNHLQDTPGFIKIKKDNLVLYLPLLGNTEGYYSYYYSPMKRVQPYWLYIYTDQPIYRTNDTVNFWGMIKPRNGTPLSSVKVRLLQNSRWDADRPILNEQTLDVNSYGTFEGNVKLTNLLPYTPYALALVIDDEIMIEKDLSVEYFAKPAYRLQITPQVYGLIRGTSFTHEIKAEFFDGTPTANTELKINYGQTISTNIKGRANFSQTYLGDYENEISYEFLGVSAAKAEEGEIYTTAQIKIFPSSQLIKVDSQSENNKATVEGSLHQLDLEAFNSGQVSFYDDPYGALVPNYPINLKVIRRWWTKEQTGTRYDYISKKVEPLYTYSDHQENFLESNLNTDDQGKFTFNFDMLADNSTYDIEVRATDENSRTILAKTYAYSSNFASPYYSDWENYFFHLETDEENADKQYSIGDNIEFKFYRGNNLLPAQSPARFLYLEAQNGIKKTAISNEPYYRLTFNEEHVPSVAIQGIWFDGKTYWATGFSGEYSGSGKILSYQEKDHNLTIEIAPGQESYEPGEEASLNLLVKKPDGQGTKALINLNLIDEAIYAVQEHNLDFNRDLYKDISPGIYTTYSSHLMPIMKGGAEGGGCFTGETKITMSDGTKKDIKDIRPGDMILTRKSSNNPSLVPSKVINTKKHLVKEYWTINDNLEITPVHIVYLNDFWQPIGQARIGDYLSNSAGQKVYIKKITKHSQLTEVYNLETDNHTFIANDFYVHNQKGGPRQNFQDKALFRTIETDKSGQAEVSFTLPDNLTSWRVTAQALNQKLYAGSETAELTVTQPFFVQAVISESYLETDKPIIKVQTFGSDLKSSDDVTIKVSSETLPMEPETFTTTGFGIVDVPLPARHSPEAKPMAGGPALSNGKHSLLIEAKSGSHKDAILRTFEVAPSRISIPVLKSEQVTLGWKPNIETERNFEIILADNHIGQYYPDLSQLLYSFGDRLDQKASRNLAANFLNQYFAENNVIETINAGSYQQSDKGGISLFPYSDDDLELSAHISASGIADQFNRERLVSYFESILNDSSQTTLNHGQSLYGLSALSEPVLLEINQMLQSDKITDTDRLYLTLGLSSAGDQTKAREIFTGLQEKYKKTIDNYDYFELGENKDEVLNNTMLAALIAASIQTDNADSYFQYVKDNTTKDILLILPQINFIEQRLTVLPQEPTEITYQLLGSEKTISLNNGKTETLALTTESQAGFQVTQLKGSAIAIIKYLRKPEASEIDLAPSLKISRSFEPETLKDGELVKVNLTVEIPESAPDGMYQVTDFVPSGCRVVNRELAPKYYDPNLVLPYRVDNQQASFTVWKETKLENFHYYLRVVNKGTFLAEQPILQSMNAPSVRMGGENAELVIE